MTKPHCTVLLIEDNPGDARLVREMLAEATDVAFDVRWVDRLEAGLLRLAAGGIDVVLLDLSLPDGHGLETFTRTKARAPDVPIVVLSGLDDEARAVQAIHDGAQDYLVKGQVTGRALVRSLRYAIERRRLAAERAELERQKDEFLTSVSHDLRTPIAAIKASISVVLANEPEQMPRPLHRMLVNIDHAADQMGQLVTDLLELTRLQVGRVQLRYGDYDVRDIAVRAVETITALAQTRRQCVELILPGEPVPARVDAERLERVLLNLLSNAHHYGHEGGLIRLELERRGQEVHLTVSDDGPGIPPSEQERIFQRFYRVDSDATRQRPGSGLGLPIARGLVALHSGQISVESAPGAGATFRVVVPVVPIAPVSASGPSEARKDIHW